MAIQSPQSKVFCRKCNSTMVPRQSLTPSQENLKWYTCSNPKCASVICLGERAADMRGLSWFIDDLALRKKEYDLVSTIMLNQESSVPSNLESHLN